MFVNLDLVLQKSCTPQNFTFTSFSTGYGADAICPYLAFELAFSLRSDNILDPNLTDEDIYKAYQGAIETGLAKVMAKMGISTLQSYKSAQIFEAVGLCEEVIDKCFRGTQSRIGKCLRTFFHIIFECSIMVSKLDLIKQLFHYISPDRHDIQVAICLRIWTAVCMYSNLILLLYTLK